MEKKSLIISARRFVREAHKAIIITTVSGDVRPQIEHLQEVADLVWASGGSDIEITSAWLHDSIEDTSTNLADIENNFCEEVAKIVHGLTDPEELKGLSNAERKLKQAKRVKNESVSVKRIKIADQISNIRFLTTDPEPTWSFDSNRDYIIGAKLIADECKGINPLLDRLFDSEYRKAVELFRI